MARLPNLFIIGVSKAGTTSLAKYLSSHEEIYVPSVKEPRFLVGNVIKTINKADPTYNYMQLSSLLSLNEYERLYDDVGTSKYCMDASVHYFNHPEDFVSNCLKYNISLADSKVILMLRDPIDRLVSNWRYQRREILKLDQALAVESHRIKSGWDSFWYYQEQSCYFKKVNYLKSMFPNILILPFTKLKNDTQGIINDVTSFLNISPLVMTEFPIYNAKINEGYLIRNSPMSIELAQNSYSNRIIREILSIFGSKDMKSTYKVSEELNFMLKSKYEQEYREYKF